jgi:hypothetical protein
MRKSSRAEKKFEVSSTERLPLRKGNSANSEYEPELGLPEPRRHEMRPAEC